MNDHQLSRLLKAAAKAHQEPEEMVAPLGFETRVLAHWKKQQPEANFIGLFRQAFACACLAALVSFALSYRTLVATPSPEQLIAYTALEVADPQ